MKEVLFIRNNIDKWRSMEEVVEKSNYESPDHLAEVYSELTADLAFSQTHYPNSRITIYLNNLASALHNEIYRNKREKWSRFITFWTREVPDVMWHERKMLYLSFAIFIVSILIGIISTAGNPEFPRIILGDAYVDMTLDNIAKGTPMGVYSSAGEHEMFASITFNNIMVSIYVFISGVLTSFAVAFQLLRNGIMVGVFDTMFYQHGLLGKALMTTMLHGTLELSAITIAGAAGLRMGAGWLFPGTYKRIESFKMSARRGLKIVVGTVPIFIIAGFIESFLTRHTELSIFIRGSIIAISAIFIIFYFLYLPYKRNHKKQIITSKANKHETIQEDSIV